MPAISHRWKTPRPSRKSEWRRRVEPQMNADEHRLKNALPCDTGYQPVRAMRHLKRTQNRDTATLRRDGRNEEDGHSCLLRSVRTSRAGRSSWRAALRVGICFDFESETQRAARRGDVARSALRYRGRSSEPPPDQRCDRSVTRVAL